MKVSETVTGSTGLTEETPEKGRRCWADVARTFPAFPENSTQNVRVPANDTSNVPPPLMELQNRIQNLGMSEDGNVCTDGIEQRIHQTVCDIFNCSTPSPVAAAGSLAMLFRVCMSRHLCTKECFRRIAVDEVQDRFQQNLKAVAEEKANAIKVLQSFSQFIGAMLVQKILPSKVSALCVQALLDQPGATNALRALLEELGQLSTKVVNEMLECGSLSASAKEQLLAASRSQKEQQESQAGESKEEESEQSSKPKTWAEIATASLPKRKAEAAETEVPVVTKKREKPKALAPIPSVTKPKDVAWGPARCATPSTAAPSPEAAIVSPAGSASSENGSSDLDVDSNSAEVSKAANPQDAGKKQAAQKSAKHAQIAKSEAANGVHSQNDVPEDAKKLTDVAKPEEVSKAKRQVAVECVTPMEISKPEEAPKESAKSKTPEIDINALFQEDSNAVVKVAKPREVKWGPKAKPAEPAGPSPANLQRIDSLTKKNNSVEGYLAEAIGIWKEETAEKKAAAQKVKDEQKVPVNTESVTALQTTNVFDEGADSGDSCCGASSTEEAAAEAAPLVNENTEVKDIKSESPKESKSEEVPEIKLDWDVDPTKAKGPVPSVVKPKDIKWGPAAKKAPKTPSAPVTQPASAQKMAAKPVSTAEPAKAKTAESIATDIKEEEKCIAKADQKNRVKDDVPAKELAPRPTKVKGPIPKEVEPVEVKWGPAKKKVVVEEAATEQVEIPAEKEEIKEETKEERQAVAEDKPADDWVTAKPTKVRQPATKTQEKPLEVTAPRFAALQEACVEDSESEDAENSLEETKPEEVEKTITDEDMEETAEEEVNDVRRIDQEKLVAKVFQSWKSSKPSDTKPPVAWGPGARNAVAKGQPTLRTPAPWSKPIGMKESVAKEKIAAPLEVVDAWDTEMEPEAEAEAEPEAVDSSLDQKEADVPTINDVYSIEFMLKWRSAVGDEQLGDFVHYSTQDVADEQPHVEKSKTDSLYKTKEELKAERRREWEAKQRALEEANTDEQQPKLEISTSEPADDWFSRRTEKKVAFTPSPNSWAARRHMMRQNTDSTCIAIKGILNKLTLEKFETLTVQLMECGISKPEHIECLVKEVFERATTQHHFIEMYTMLCGKFSEWRVEAGVSEKESSFKKILLNQCQDSFEKYLKAPEISDDLPEEERTELHMKYKTKMVGNIKFVGQLLINKMLSSKIMLQCSEELMRLNTDETLETLCAFLRTTGPSFDVPGWKLHGPFNDLLTNLRGLTKDRKAVSPRIRCLIQDVLDLQASGWVCRREVEGPKMMAEVKADWQRDHGEDMPLSPSKSEWETAVKKGSRRS
jgi:hypothetical protein